MEIAKKIKIKKGIQYKCPTTHEWINTLSYIQAVAYWKAMKNEVAEEIPGP